MPAGRPRKRRLVRDTCKFPQRFSERAAEEPGEEAKPDHGRDDETAMLMMTAIHLTSLEKTTLAPRGLQGSPKKKHKESR